MMLSTRSSYSPRRQMRMAMVMLVYQFELNQELISVQTLFESDAAAVLFDYQHSFGPHHQRMYQEQLRLLQVLAKNYLNLRALIMRFVRADWTWMRMSPLVRALLLCACVELKRLDLGIVANEYVAMAKDFIPASSDYRFVNIVIDRVNQFYHEQQIKTS